MSDFGPWESCRLVSRPLLGVTLRAYPAPCGRLALLLRLRRPSGYGFHLRRTLRKCRPWHLGAGPTRLASPSVTRAGYGKFNETEITTMYQNKVTLIGFLGNDAEVRTNDNRSFTTLSLATKIFLQEGRQVHLAHRMAPLRRLRQARRVRRHAEEGRSSPGRRRAAQPEVRQQEDELGADHLGDPGGLDSQAGSGREGQPGRAGR